LSILTNQGEEVTPRGARNHEEPQSRESHDFSPFPSSFESFSVQENSFQMDDRLCDWRVFQDATLCPNFEVYHGFYVTSFILAALSLIFVMGALAIRVRLWDLTFFFLPMYVPRQLEILLS